jgi:hypothetical protein
MGDVAGVGVTGGLFVNVNGLVLIIDVFTPGNIPYI